MSGGVAQLISRYAARGALVDSNMMLLHFVGGFQPELIRRFKRTAQFTVEDYHLLRYVLAQFRSIITTPRVLSEVGNLSAQLGEPLRREYFAHFARGIALLDEHYVTSADAARHEGFTRFGLTDCGIADLAVRKYLVLTDDLRLAQYLGSLGVDALNFNHIRTLSWR
jgi:hypothetical protein